MSFDPTAQGTRSHVSTSTDRLSCTDLPPLFSLWIDQHLAATVESRRLAESTRNFSANTIATRLIDPRLADVAYPLSFQAASGVVLTDVDGRRFLDFELAQGSAVWGHRHPAIFTAQHELLQGGLTHAVRHPLLPAVSQQMVDLLGLNRVAFFGTRADAMMIAIRLGRGLRQKPRIALFQGARHGAYDATQMRPANPFRSDGKARFAGMGLAPGLAEHSLVLPFGSDQAFDLLKQHAADVAMVLIDPLCRLDQESSDADFLPRFAGLCRQLGIAVLADEYELGWHLGLAGSQELLQQPSDLVLYGPALAAGFPCVALGDRSDFLQALNGGEAAHHAPHQRVGHTDPHAPALHSLAAAHQVLNDLQTDRGAALSATAGHAAAFADDLNEWFRDNELSLQVQRVGSLLRLKGRFDATALTLRLVARGIHLGQNRTFYLAPVHDHKQRAYLAQALRATAVELANAGLMARTADNSGDLAPVAETITRDEVTAPANAANAVALVSTPQEEPEPIAAIVQRVPCNEAQRGIIFHKQLNDNAAVAYHEPLLLHFKGRCEVARLERAINETISRHSILRASLAEAGDFLDIWNFAALAVEEVTISAEPGRTRAEQVAHLVTAAARKPFNLSAPPLLHATVFHLGGDEHLFLLVAHHALVDGISFSTISEEIATHYNQGHHGSLKDEVLAFDESKRPWEMMSEERREPLRRYWLDRFADEVPLLQLPFDHVPTPIPSFTGGRHRLNLDAAVAQRVVTVARELGTTPYALLLGVFKLWLCRMSGQDDLVVGVPTSQRAHRRRQRVVGHFIEMIPVRSQIDLSRPFGAYIQQLTDLLFDGIDHAAFPFGDLIRQLHKQRAMDRSPLYNVEFNMDPHNATPAFDGAEVEYISLNAPMNEVQLSDGSRFLPDSGSAKLDLTLSIELGDDHLTALFEYADDVFAGATVAYLADCFGELLRGCLAQPMAPMVKAPLITDAQRHALLIERNQTRRALPAFTPFIQQFETQVAQTPTRLAASYEDVRLTYAELNAQANRLAAGLSQAGVTRGDLVALLGYRDHYFLISMLAVFKLGAAYLPLDPKHPADRIAGILSESKARFTMLTNEPMDLAAEAAARLEASAPNVLHAPSLIERHDSEANPPKVSQLEDLAYVIFTSGSTGRPKGAMIENLGMINHLYAKVWDLNMDADSIVGQNASQCFDISIWQFLSALLTGGAVRIFSENVVYDPRLLIREVVDHRLTIFESVPSMKREMLSLLEADTQRPAFSDLLWVMLTGEALPPEICTRWLTMYPHIPIVNAYGPTECSDDVTHHIVAQPPGPEVVNMAIGAPIVNTFAYVVDAHNNLLPHGVVGELCIGGLGVGRGYLNNAAQTAKAFGDDPFAAELPQLLPAGVLPDHPHRLYRTGDLVRWLADGTLEYLGRIDNQVKIRGYRIELGEIEAAVKDHAAVEETIVVAAKHHGTHQSLAAYLTCKADWIRNRQRNLVADWAKVFDETYDETDANSAFNVWQDSYARLPVPAEQVAESLDIAAGRILALKPQRLLEIGCGAGLILERVAPHCRQVLALDISQTALQLAGQKMSGLGHVALRRGALDEIEALLDNEDVFDTIVLNEVLQYVPSESYLLERLQRVFDKVADGGHLFLGGIRSMALQDAYLTSVLRYQADADQNVQTLREQLAEARRRETEMLIDPGFFQLLVAQLTQVAQVQVLVKASVHDNEFVRYRYDVVLRKGAPAVETNTPTYRDWQTENWDLERLAQALAAGDNDRLCFKDVPNQRTDEDRRCLLWLAEADEKATIGVLRDHLAAGDNSTGIAFADLEDLAQRYGYRLHLCCAGADRFGAFDALFLRGEAPLPAPRFKPIRGDQYRPLTSFPLGNSLQNELVPEIRRALEQQLPEYMVPPDFVVLDRFPLTPNGKIDRKLLPAPSVRERGRDENFEPPLGETEKHIAAVWSQILGLPTIGRHDSFFELGGHSLLATQIITRLQQQFDREIRVRDLFQEPTIAGLAAIMSGASTDTPTKAVPAVQRHDGPAQLSYAQERLWFIDQLESTGATWNIPLAMVLEGELDRDALKRALDTIWNRHEVLRSRFSESDGKPRIHFMPPGRFALIEETCRLSQADDRDAHIQQVMHAEEHFPFNLETGPLFRGRLLHFDTNHHALVLNMHHVVTDGWSVGLLFEELADLYQAFRTGAEDPLAPLSVQYRDFAVWQRQWLADGVLQQQETYWQQQLAGLTPLELPYDRARPARQTYDAANIRFTLSPQRSRQLTELSKKHGATLFMTLEACFALLLSRYSRQDDVALGSPIANRVRPELEALIGFFVNTLVIRNDLSGDPTFSEYLARVKATTLSAFEHQDIPFERVVDAVGEERDLSRSPLFQVIFVLQNIANQPRPLHGLTLTPIEPQPSTINFDMIMAMWESDDCLHGSLEYNTHLFDAATVQHMVTLFENLLGAVCAAPDTKLSRLNLLSDTETQRLGRGFSAPSGGAAARQAPSETLKARFERMVQTFATRPAITLDGQSLSYAELNRRANRLAHALTAQGVAVDTPVAVCLEPSFDQVIAMLAVCKAGGGYVPLDPKNPDERLSQILSETQSPVLITDRANAARFSDQTLLVVDGPAAETWQNETNPVVDVACHNMAYTIFTSGSTGKPKGVVLEHRQVIGLFTSTDHWFSFNENDVWSMFHAYTFDFSVWEMWGALLYGGRLVLVPYRVTRNPQQFYHLLAREQVTILNQTPSALYQLIKAEGELHDDRCPIDALALRFIVLGGEAVTPAKLAPWFDRARTAEPKLINMYGITETTVHTTYQPITADMAHAAAASAIGPAIPDMGVHLLDDHMNPIAPGMIGEIYVSGRGVARGYMGRADLTASRFVPNPFSDKPGERLYRSGDLARLTHDGQLVYVGRRDHQIKLRGFRIELGEIEKALLLHPLVREAVVLLFQEQLVSWLVMHEPHPSPESLRDHMRRHVPEYMVPSAFVAMDRFPINQNNKLDRKALPAPNLSDRSSSRAEASRGPRQQALVEIWQEVLQLEEVGINHNFFQLGGDSLTSIQIRAKARARGYDFELIQLFENPTIETLDNVLSDTVADEAGVTEALALLSDEDRTQLQERADLVDAYPATALQQGMMFHAVYDRESLLYRDLFYYDVCLPFDRAALERTYADLFAAHPILRTRFDLENFSEPLQLVHRNGVLDIEEIDSRDKSATDLDAWNNAQLNRGFDFSDGNLFQVKVHHLDGKGAAVFRLVHYFPHVLFDGWSEATLFTEWLNRYRAHLQQTTVAPVTEQTGFRDFVALERAALVSSETQEYWRNYLAQGESHTLPHLQQVDDLATEGHYGYRWIRLSAETSHAIKALADRLGLPLKTLLLTAHLKAMAVIHGNEKVLSGYVNNGRPETLDGHNAIGLFLNTLPLRLPSLQGSWLDLVQAVYQTERAHLPHRRLPLPALLEQQQVRRLFDVTFNFTHFRVLGEADSEATAVENRGGISIPDLTLIASFRMEYDDTQILAHLDFSDKVLSGEVVEQFAEIYANVLETMAQSPEQSHRAQHLLPANQWAAQSAHLSQPAARDDHDDLGSRVAALAAQHPDQVALIDDAKRVTYSELLQRADALARALVATGLKPEDVVGVHMEAGPELVIAVLAILRAGGCYLPLDTKNPPARLQTMLRSSGARRVLCAIERVAAARPWLEAEQAQCLTLDQLRDQPGQTLPPPNAQRAAYINFTSGSTGTPKGVVVTHANVLRLVEDRELCRLGHDDTVAQLANPAFDAFTFEIWTALTHGARIAFVAGPVLLDAERLAAWFEQQRVTTLFMTVALFSRLVHQKPDLFAGLKYVLFGGAQADTVALRAVQDAAAPAHLINGYGPTETTTFAATYRCSTPVEPGSRLPIGSAIHQTGLYVLNDQLHPVPTGVVGRIFIGGHGVTRGYVNQPQRTAERFLPDPFIGLAGARMYDSGDLGYWNQDGELVCLGRNDDQVKLRGFRIELGEIENALCRLDGIKAAAVRVLDGAEGIGDLVAWVIPAFAHMKLDADGLRECLAEVLPAYMVPHHFVQIRTWPLTANGKIDYAGLPHPQPVPEAAAVVTTAAAAPTLSATESMLADLWRDILGRGPITRDSDFFALGGHSLHAMRLMTRLRRLGYDLEIRVLFEHPRLADLAAKLDGDSDDDGPRGPNGGVEPNSALDTPDASPELRDGCDPADAAPLTQAQERLWFLQRLNPDDFAYNIPFALRLRGDLETDTLQRALDALIHRQRAVATRFAGDETGVRQFPGQRVVIARVALANETALTPALQAAARQPFQLTEEPSLRVNLFSLAPDDHVLFVCLHHIVADGWSLEILMQEWTELYRALRHGQTPQLPELAGQFSDIARRQQTDAPDFARELSWWCQRLQGIPAYLDLASDFPRHEDLPPAGESLLLALDERVSSAIRDWCRREKVTPFSWFMSAFAWLLRVHSGQDDLCIGLPVANRHSHDEEHLIGFFANTLVKRYQFATGDLFNNVVRAAADDLLDMFSYSSLPFDLLVNELQPQRDLARTPIYQVMFSFENSALGDKQTATFDGLTQSSQDFDAAVGKSELSLFMEDDGQCFLGEFTFNPGLFARAGAERLLEQLTVLCHNLADSPNQTLQPALLLPPGASIRLDGGALPADLAFDAGLLGGFERVARQQPDAVALQCGTQGWTYAQLNRAANALAHHLIARGVGAETRVGLSMARNPHCLLGILAILKAGGCYVPIDPNFPADRTQIMMEDGGVTLCLTETGQALGLRALAAEWLEVDRFFEELELDSLPAEQLTTPELQFSREQTAYVIFTSGSTGRPKGVPVAHGGVVALLHWARQHYAEEQHQLIAATTSFSFDISVFELFLPLSAGGTVLLLDNALQMIDEISEPVLINSVPSAVRELVRRNAVPTSVRTVNLAGEALPADLVADLYRLPHIERVFNLYGPSEDTVYSTFAQLPNSIQAGDTVPIGRLLPGTYGYVLDAAGEPVAPGSVGELVLGGIALSRGYLNRPDATAERFITDPFADNAQRLYRTGDLVRQQPDGALLFLGRGDHQVKLRGFRIECGELETHLRQIDAVQDAVVDLVRGQDGDAALCCWYVLEAGAVCDVETLRETLRQRVPAYMVPTYFSALGRLPQTPSGKIDRRRLPAPNPNAQPTRTAQSVPSDPVAQSLAAIYCELLGVDQVFLEDDFFALGGHSLLANRLMALIHKRLDVNLPLRALFETPCLGALAATVKTQRGDITAGAIGIADDLSRLSLPQERLAFIEAFQGLGATYNMPSAWIIDGPLDIALLQEALTRAVAQHRELTANFVWADGQARRRYRETDVLAWETLDLCDQPNAEQRAQQWCDNLAGRPFDLAEDALCRIGLATLAGGVNPRHQLVIVIHHIVADGESLAVFHNDWQTAYLALRDGREPQLADSAHSYADYAVWQREALAPLFAKQSVYWREALADAPQVLELPTDFPRPAQQTFNGAHHDFVLPAVVAQPLLRIAQAMGATPFTALLSLWSLLLARTAGQNDVVVGTPVANRPLHQLESMVGFFVNMVPLRARIDEQQSYTDFLAAMRDQVLQAFAHGDLPFEQLVETLQPERSASHTPIFQTVFSLERPGEEVQQLGDLTLTDSDSGSPSAKFDLMLAVVAQDDAYLCTIAYNTDLFNTSTIKRMALCYNFLAEILASNADQPLQATATLPPKLENQVRAMADNGDGDYSGERCVARLFERAVARFGDTIALDDGSECLSYKALDQRANQLANLLIEKGLQTGRGIGLHMTRSIDAVVVMVAAAKLGCPYVPLDPAYPQERLKFMIADADPQFVVTDDSDASLTTHPLIWSSLNLAGAPATPPSRTADADDLLYIIYTSGSTGRPKGVPIRQRNLIGLTQRDAFYQSEPGQTQLHAASISFDAAVLEVWNALLNGLRLLILPYDATEKLAALLEQQPVDHMWLTAQWFHHMVESHLPVLANVKNLYTGGDVVSPEHARRFLEAHPDNTLVNGYGPTEACVFTTTHRITQADLTRANLPLGRPLSGIELYVLDAQGRLCAPGVYGELMIGGESIADGYHQRPELSAERFIAHPFKPGRKLYRTGDRVCLDETGTVLFGGRLDRQIKLRGFRLEPGEIEAQLRRHPAVRNAHVDVITRGDDKQLCAWLVRQENAASDPDRDQLNQFLAQNLPDFAIPSACLWLDQLPATDNGKIDRRALPQPSEVAGEGYVAPVGAVQTGLAAVWAELLDLDHDQVGAHDHFFERGGHSLMVARLIPRIRERFGLDLPLAAFFEHPTLAQQADLIETLSFTAPSPDTDDFEDGEI